MIEINENPYSNPSSQIKKNDENESGKLSKAIRIGSINLQGRIIKNKELILQNFNEMKMDILILIDPGKYEEINFYNLEMIEGIYNPQDPAGRIIILMRKNKFKFLKKEQKINRILEIEIIVPINLRIIGIYRKSGNKKENKIINESILNINSKKAIILGDFNSTSSNKKIDSISLSKNGNHKFMNELFNKKWKDVFREINPKIEQFTHFGGTGPSSIKMEVRTRIDHIITKNEILNLIQDCKIIEMNIFLSDHRLIYTDLTTTNINFKEIIKTRKGINNEEKWNKFIEESNLNLNEIKLNEINNKEELNEFYLKIEEAIKIPYDKIFPKTNKIKLLIKNKIPEEIKKLIEIKKKCFKILNKLRKIFKSKEEKFQKLEKLKEKFQKKIKNFIENLKNEKIIKETNYENSLLNFFKKLENFLTQKIQKKFKKIKNEKINEKKEKENQILEENQTKIFEKFKNFTPREKITHLENENGKLISEPEKINEIIVDHYKKIFSNENKGGNIDEFLKNTPSIINNELNLKFSKKKIKEKLIGRNYSTPGPCEISFKIILKLAENSKIILAKS